MAATVREAVRELMAQTMATIDALLEASDTSLRCHPHTLVRREGRVDPHHERHRSRKIHTGQVLDGRYESRITASPTQRLIAEWLTEGRGVTIVMCRQPRVVDLHQQAGIDDRLVLLMHGLGEPQRNNPDRSRSAGWG